VQNGYKLFLPCLRTSLGEKGSGWATPDGWGCFDFLGPRNSPETKQYKKFHDFTINVSLWKRWRSWENACSYGYVEK